MNETTSVAPFSDPDEILAGPEIKITDPWPRALRLIVVATAGESMDALVYPNVHWDGYRWWRWNGGQWMDSSIPTEIVARYSIPVAPPTLNTGLKAQVVRKKIENAEAVAGITVIALLLLEPMYFAVTGNSFAPMWMLWLVGVLVVIAILALVVAEPILRRIAVRELAAGYTTMFSSWRVLGQRREQEYAPYWQLDVTTGAAIRMPGQPVIHEVLWANLSAEERESFSSGRMVAVPPTSPPSLLPGCSARRRLRVLAGVS